MGLESEIVASQLAPGILGTTDPTDQAPDTSLADLASVTSVRDAHVRCLLPESTVCTITIVGPKIREAITHDALAFIACFSETSINKEKTYQNEELALAVEQFRLRNPQRPWLFPVRITNCDLPPTTWVPEGH